MKYAYNSDKSKWSDYYTYYTYYFEFIISNDNNNNYLLIFIQNYFKGGTISHLNRPPATAKELIRHNFLTINSSSYVYLNNNIDNETNIYLLFSFLNYKNNITEYTVYHTMDNYFDDKAFNYLSSSRLQNPRKKNNTINE